MNWTKLADEETIRQTTERLKERGVNVELYQNREDALKRLTGLIPAGAQVMTGGSETLREIGFVDLLKSGKHSWKNLKEEILSEKNQLKQLELRKQTTTADYFLVSVNAVTQSGEVFVASGTVSQLASYAFSSDNFVWVVGVQKIVENMEEAMRRICEYCLPLEDKRMKDAGFSGSSVGKILIFKRETLPKRSVTLIWINEKVGV